MLLAMNLILYSQGNPPIYSLPDTTRYSTFFGSKFINEDFYWSGKNFRWRSGYGGLLDVSWTSNQGLFKTDFMTATITYFNYSFLTINTFDFPMNLSKKRFYSQLFYVFPIGLRVPLFSGRNYDLGANMNYYWPFNMKREDHDSMYYETIIIDKNTKTTYKNSPQILDYNIMLRIRVSKYACFSITTGYRDQLTPWYGKNFGSLIYSNDISGFYFGFSLGFSIFTKENRGIESWEKAKSENTVPAYKKFLADFPGNHYLKETNSRIEDILYLNAIRGTETDCRKYLLEPDFKKYRTLIEKRYSEIEDNAYHSAQNGTSTDCESYLSRFDNGKYQTQVKKLKASKIKYADSTDYQKAMAGTISDCEFYLSKYPDGIYRNQIIEEKNNKIEQAMYFSARDGDYSQCDRYLELYPDGKFIQEVIGLRTKKFLEEEGVVYTKIKEGDYEACRDYKSRFSKGRFTGEAESLCQMLKYMSISKMTMLDLINPSIKNIELVKSMPGDGEYNYDVVIVTASGSTVYANAITSERIVFEIMAAPLSDQGAFISTFGGKGTKMDITLLTKGFDYNGLKWYPTANHDAIIICTGDRIIGYNVRYEQNTGTVKK
ncbi:MAG: hypothetical protein U0X39_01615 [Bacteroidales bacterium]